MGGLGTDEVDVVLGKDLRKPGVFCEKTVAWMHRIGAGDLTGGKQRGNVEVAVARRGRADADTLVREPNMHRVLVCGGMHGDGRYAELLAGAQHAQRDFTAICDQDLVEHFGMLKRRMWRSAGGNGGRAFIR